jgi:hypothetical protein
MLWLLVQNVYTVKPILRGHLWNKEKWPYKTGDPLKEVQFIWNFLGQEKGDLLMQVNALACLTECFFIYFSGNKIPAGKTRYKER